MATTTRGATVIDRATNFLIKEEGFSSTAKWDYKQWSWGYGTSAGSNPAVKPTGTITKEEAKRALLSNLEGAYKLITNALTRPVSDNMLVALLSFNYNVGYGSIAKGGTAAIIDRINRGLSKDQVADAIELYNKVTVVKNGQKVRQVHPVLKARRERESALFIA